MRFLTIVVAVLVLTCAPKLVQASPGKISVSGTGEVIVFPDRARLIVAVRTFSPEAEDALGSNNDKMSRIVDGLQSMGIARENIQTEEFSLERRFDYNPDTGEETRKLLGYDVKNSVLIETELVERVGEILKNVIDWGATDIDSLSFFVSVTDSHVAKARAAAMDDATRVAKGISEAAGVELHGIISIETTSSYGSESGAPIRINLVGDEIDRYPLFMASKKIKHSLNVEFEIRKK